MNKEAIIHTRINKNIKGRAEQIFRTIGIKPSEAISMFYNQVVLHRGLPFKVEIPNNVTLQALEEVNDLDELESFKSVDELFSNLNT